MEPWVGIQESQEEDDRISCGYKFVPWLNWNQWNFVRRSLFSSSPNSISAAFKRISAWRSRGCLPVAVEITASIVEIQQRDPFFREGSSSDALLSEEMLAMLYCMAIIRLVNGVVEKTRKKTEVSLAEAADYIGIPRMLIDIRHEGSHRDLPSLQLVRLASIKAIEWLRTSYWEPQKNAIPYQRDGPANVRKDIRARLRELAFCLTIKKAQPTSLTNCRRVKHYEMLCGRNKFFSRMVGKLQSSKSGGSKKHITKTLRSLVQLYSSFSSEVVSILLEFLLNASKSSDSNEMESFDGPQVEPHLDDSKALTGTIDDWKLVVKKFSDKEPELLLTMLKTVLEMIESHKAMKNETGGHNLQSSQHSTGIYQIEHLSSLVLWLVRNLQEVRPLQPRGSDAGNLSFSPKADVPKEILKELLQKCLLVSVPGNIQLMTSAVLLAQMIGNSSVVEKLKKLSLLRMPELDSSDESSNPAGMERILFRHNDSISQAAEKLEFLKSCRTKSKMVGTAPSNAGTEMKQTWTVVKTWNPCPIGMLPRILGSSGVLPVLDQVDNQQVFQELSGNKDNWNLSRRNGKREASCVVETLDNLGSAKKMREAVEEDGSESLNDGDAFSLEPVKGRLLIDGVWKEVGKEELLAIESAVRILV